MHPTPNTIKLLEKTPGLSHIRVLTNEEKRMVAALEGKENHGVHACLQYPLTLAVAHDGQFREPPMPIVAIQGDKAVFPPIPFPELGNAISSSPSKKVHDFLVKHFALPITDDHATLIIGCNARV